MPWLHFVFLGVTVSVPPVQYITEEFRIGKCVGLRSIGKGVHGLVLGSTLFNGLSIAHDYTEMKIGYAMSTCGHDPVSPEDGEAWGGDPISGGPDTIHSRPHVLQNRYYSDGS